MNFKTVPIDSITVDRAIRQRRELNNIEELAESIRRVGDETGECGLINPITVNKDMVLIAGERRLTACKMLGWTSIPVRFFENLPEREQRLVELEENVRRLGLTWQEEVKAVQDYHNLRKSSEPDWSQEKTAEALGFTGATANRYLVVASKMDDPQVAKADKFSTALGLVTRARERQAASVLESLDEPEVEEQVDGEPAPAAPVKVVAKIPLINADFIEWSAAYTGPKFNFLHCDFPYGVNMHDSGQGAGQGFGTYQDSPDVYWKLLDHLSAVMDKLVADSAHMIFWFSMDFYSDTLVRLKLMDWNVSPFPLIWHKSDNTGILPDSKRQPRRVYETAFFCTRGDRFLATGPHGQGPVANSFAAPGRDKSIHMNEKPVEMLRHFMRLCVDEYSVMLDPTCGSGNAVKAAELLGAHSVLGIERDPEFYARAVQAYPATGPVTL